MSTINAIRPPEAGETPLSPDEIRIAEAEAKKPKAQIMVENLPPHVTLEWVLSRCTKCPDCGAMSLWPSRKKDKNKSPKLDLTPKNGPRQKWFVRRLVFHFKNPGVPLPDGRSRVITCKCENSHCINPELVYLTTKTKAFRVASERGAWDKTKMSLVTRESAAKRVKLSDEAVIDIISSDTPPDEAAIKHNCSSAYVRMLRKGQWRKRTTAVANKANPFFGLGARA